MAGGRAELRLAQRTRVKVCGITRPADGFAAAALGADAIGLVFYPESPRAVDLAQAAPGVNVNVLSPTGPGRFDPIGGMSQLTGIPVEVEAA